MQYGELYHKNYYSCLLYTSQTVLSKYAPGEDELYMRTLELGQVQESDFYSHVMHDDLDSIVRDIREAHRKDKMCIRDSPCPPGHASGRRAASPRRTSPAGNGS